MQTMTAPTPKINGSVQSRNQTAFSVLKTTNYDMFKMMADNRNLNLLHVKRLVESFKDTYLICPIIVNERHEVIDGQHRLRAAKETNNPVYYMVINGYGIKEVQILNTNQKNWGKIDFLHMYCAEGRKPYLEFKDFMTHFPDFGIQPAERILTGLSGGGKQGVIDGKKAHMKYFEEGKLSIPNLSQSYSIARKIMEFKPYTDVYNNGTFVSAMLPLFKSKVYNHKEMIHKLSNYPNRLHTCKKVEDFRLMLEDIYNYKRQKENKVSFRYE